MFDFEAALREWRSTARTCSLSGGELDELEDHLHSAYLAHVARGTEPPEAFAIALRTLGTLEQISAEYRKVRGPTWRSLLEAGWVAFAVAFLLPVADGGITLTELNLHEGLLPGFEALRIALEEGGWYGLGGLTNLLVLATMWRASEIGRGRALCLGIAVSLSGLLNGVLWMGAGLDLLPGYYTWLASFGLVSSALLVRARELGGLAPASTAAT